MARTYDGLMRHGKLMRQAHARVRPGFKVTWWEWWNFTAFQTQEKVLGYRPLLKKMCQIVDGPEPAVCTFRESLRILIKMKKK